MRKLSLPQLIVIAIFESQAIRTKRALLSSPRVFFLLALYLLLLFPRTASATLISYDNFSYPLGNLAGQESGTGFSGPWTAENNPGDGTFTVLTGPSMAGVGMYSSGILNLDDIANGSYAVYDNVNLTGATTFKARVAAGPGGTISIYTGSATGTLLGTVTVPNSGGWQNWVTVSCPLTGASGTQNVYLVFSGSGTGGLINLEWFAFGDSSPIWASNYSSLVGGIGSQPCSEVECVQYTGNSTNAVATLSRAFKTPLSGTYYGCYTFSADLTGSSGPAGGMATGSATNTNSNAAFSWSGNGSGSLETNAEANGTVASGTENISSNTQYLYIFTTNTATNTTTGWILTAVQLSNFLANNTLTLANLNAAAIGTAATDVFSRQTATASGTAAAQSNLILFGNNEGQTAYSFTFGGFCISNAGVLEAVTANVATPPTIYVPTQNSNESVVAAATPQEYGAVADGVTDNTAAFQAAINAVYDKGHRAGGVVYVPAGIYAFYGNLVLPQGVTLHGDWKDWTTGTGGAVGTTFAIHTTGPATGTPFLTMVESCGIKGINFWYPEQSASSITPYPFTIQLADNSVIQNIVLINSYQGINTSPSSSPARSLLSSIIGSPLSIGFTTDRAGDVASTEDIRFSPTPWEVSGLANAPAAGGPQEAWMLANGIGFQVKRADTILSTFTNVSGYNIGIDLIPGTTGAPGVSFYGGIVTGCNTAIAMSDSAGQTGMQFTNMTLSGVTGYNFDSTSYTCYAQFYNCQITGTGGTSVSMTGSSGWNNWVQLQDCTITGTLVQNTGVFNLVDCSITAPTQCTIASTTTRTGFTGCTFSPSQKIVNNGSAAHLFIDPHQAEPSSPPTFSSWSTIISQYQACKPAKTTLFIATTGYGATGNGTTDDTSAIQAALNAAGANGGGIVYLPGGHYKTSTSLTVPSGVELRGVYELRHDCGPWPDGFCKDSVIQPTGGSGTTTGPAAVALKANSGIRGIDFSYETQNSTPILFPAAIQGQGANVYAIGIVTPNAYNYVDMDTYNCPNHFLYMVDGNVLNQIFHVGNGSSGTIVACQFNPTFWAINGDSNSVLGANGINSAAVQTFSQSNSSMFLLGNCTETILKTFTIFPLNLFNCVSESGVGPKVNGYCNFGDVATQPWYFSSNDPNSVINLVNNSSAISDIPNMTTGSVAVTSTPSFAGTVRFYNMSIFDNPNYNFLIGGGDVGVELLHGFQFAQAGSIVSGGVFHLANEGDYYPGTGSAVANNIAFTSPGLPDDVSELIGNFGNLGYTYTNTDWGNYLDIWNNYGENNTSDLTSPSANTGMPIEASSFNSQGGGSGAIGTQTCSEGGLNLDEITAGSYTVYNNVDLNGATSFIVREACWSAGTTLQICLDSATNTPIATCTLPPTGGTETWVTSACALSGVSGYHNVYLINTTGHDHNLEWFAFQQGNIGAIEASSYNSSGGGSETISTQNCSEGGLNVDDISNGAYTVYNNLDLNGTTSFIARVASYLPLGESAGNIFVHLDSPTGTLVGTCPIDGTGGWQNWTTVNCPLSGATGYHSVYLVYDGPLNLEWFAFEGASTTTEAASYNNMSTGMNVQTSSEGGSCIGDIASGDYAVYNNVNLNGMTTLEMRTACANTNGCTITVHLDSPTGTQIGTLAVTDTGGWQTWATQTCDLSGASGYHNVYFVFSISVNVEWFGFVPGNTGAIEAASENGMSSAMNTQTCNEGGLYLGDIGAGDYAVYNSVNLNNATGLEVRAACPNTNGCTITAHLDSATGTVIGTITVPNTGGWQNWATETCPLTGASGYHNVYLVFSTSVNVEWLGFDY